MRIEIINREGGFITDFELESNPFKVGETLSVNVSNNCTDKALYDCEFAKKSQVRNKELIDK